MPALPARPSLRAWAALALTLIIGFYTLTLFLAAGCVYVPFWLLRQDQGGVNAQIVLLLVGGVAMAGTLLWSVVPRREKFSAPGPRLEPSLHPRLFAEVERLATALSEPPPQEVYLVPSVNAGVTERGGAMGFGSVRVMLLGLPLLQILTVSQFRAVLAHEFGHYYGGDTRLGPWVYKTRAAMVRSLLGLSQPNAALNMLTRVAVVRLAHYMVIKVLLAYWNLFLRITQSISRRQEYRADELACCATGARGLIEGLRRIHGAAAALPAYQNELSQTLSAGYRPAIAEGFARFMAAPAIAQAVSTQIEKDLKEKRTKPYDSHPPLRDRIARARSLLPGEAPENDPSAISLLEDVTGVELQMLQHLNPKRNMAELKTVSWENIGTDVWVPLWRRFAEGEAALLKGLTVSALPEAVKNLREMGSHIRDPKGILLTPEQRAQRAGALLGMAFGLALIEAGWQLYAQPGESYFQHGADKIDPFETVQRLAAGTLTGSDWLERSKALGIDSLLLDRVKLPAAPDGAHAGDP